MVKWEASFWRREKLATGTWLEFLHTKKPEKISSGSGSSDPMAISHHLHRTQIHDFADAIRNDRNPLVDGLEGRKSVALIQAIYESSRTGMTVTPSLIEEKIELAYSFSCSISLVSHSTCDHQKKIVFIMHSFCHHSKLICSMMRSVVSKASGFLF